MLFQKNWFFVIVIVAASFFPPSLTATADEIEEALQEFAFALQDEVSRTSVLDADEDQTPVDALPERFNESHIQYTDNFTIPTTIFVDCKPRLETDSQVVELVNATGLMALLESDGNVTSRRTPAQCVTILFYSSWCSFSCLAAPHFNALPRAFPDVKVAAIDAMKHYSLNTQFGIVGVPTILLFHNGRPAARFNESDFNLKTMSDFITKYTDLEPKSLLNVTSADFAGPVLSVAERETDHWLILSWVFVILCAVYFLVQSALWRSLVEALKNIWREADEAQEETHQHAD